MPCTKYLAAHDPRVTTARVTARSRAPGRSTIRTAPNGRCPGGSRRRVSRCHRISSAGDAVRWTLQCRGLDLPSVRKRLTRSDLGLGNARRIGDTSCTRASCLAQSVLPEGKSRPYSTQRGHDQGQSGSIDFHIVFSLRVTKRTFRILGSAVRGLSKEKKRTLGTIFTKYPVVTKCYQKPLRSPSLPHLPSRLPRKSLQSPQLGLNALVLLVKIVSV